MSMDKDNNLPETEKATDTENQVETDIDNTNVTAENEPEIKPEADNDDLTEKTEKPKKEPKEKLKSTFRLKYGSYATAIAAIFIAVVVLLNVVVSVLSDRYPLALDLTADNTYSVNKENIDFLKKVDYEVKLRVLFTEDLYKEGSYFTNSRGVTDTSGGKYYKQTVDLLNQYHKYNKNISVEYVDPYGDKISSIVEEYTAEDLTMDYGDILVECYNNGAENEPKRGVISFNDCYELESQTDSQYSYTGYESYNLTGNKIEQAVANGIFKTVNLQNVNVALITVNSSDSYVSNFKSTCEDNAFTVDTKAIIEGTDFSKYDVMIICAPGADYTPAEISTLEKWLDNNGKKGKTLMFFASAASPKLPNLYAFLEEWGIAFERGYKYYSKDSTYYSTDRTNIYLETTGTDYTAAVENGGYNFIANNMVPMSAVYESELNGTRTVETVLQTVDASTYKKPDNDSSWKATGAGSEQPAMLVSKDASDDASSYILACSSVDFLTNSNTVNKSDNGNFKLLINVLNTTSRSDEDQYVMETKVISDSSGAFTQSTTEAQNIMIAIVFMGIIPIALIAAAILVYIRRKNY